MYASGHICYPPERHINEKYSDLGEGKECMQRERRTFLHPVKS